MVMKARFILFLLAFLDGLYQVMFYWVIPLLNSNDP